MSTKQADFRFAARIQQIANILYAKQLLLFPHEIGNHTNLINIRQYLSACVILDEVLD
jgi:hypothetical protein